MTQRGEQLTHQILQDLTCPQCQYNLRGLSGAVVNCPECGFHCDVAQLVARKWIGPWTRAPGYSRLLMPVAWVSIASFGVLIALIFDAAAFQSPAFFTLFVGGGVLSVWIALIMRTRRQHADGGALILALFTHVLFAAYIGGIVGFFWGLVFSFQHQEGSEILFGVIITVASAGLLWACRRGERYVAECCIRDHLLQTMPRSV